MYPWDVLGVERDADKKTIRRAYAALTKKFHPEENPQEFAQLQQAYQDALQQIGQKSVTFQTKVHQKEEVNKPEPQLFKEPEPQLSEEPEPNLLDRLEEIQDNRLEKALQSGMLQKMDMLLQDKKKKNKPAFWRNLLSSQEFYDCFISQKFMEMLEIYLNNQPIETELAEVPQAFITELAIAYGMECGQETQLFDSGETIYAKGVIAAFFNRQIPEWREQRGIRIIRRPENALRRKEISLYIKFRLLIEKKGLCLEDEKEWSQDLWELMYAKDMGLLEDLLRRYTLSDEVIRKIIETLQLEYTNVRSLELVGIKKIITEKYGMKKYYEEKKHREEMRNWFRLYYELGEEGKNPLAVDMEKYKAKADVLFENDIWKNHSMDEDFIAMLYEQERMTWILPDVAERFYQRYYNYDMKDFRVRYLMEKAILCIYSRSCCDVGYPTYTMLHFILAYAFGMRKMPAGNRLYRSGTYKYEDYIKNKELYLPGYVAQTYGLYMEKAKKKFYEKEITVQLSDGHELRAIYKGMCFAFYWDGRYCLHPCIPLANFKRYEKETQDIEKWLLLLAMTELTAGEETEYLMEVMNKQYDKICEKILISKGVFSQIQLLICLGKDMLAHVNYRMIYDNDPPVVIIDKEKFQPYVYTHTGLDKMRIRQMGDYTPQTIEEAMQIYRCPTPECIQKISFAGKEKAERGLLLMEGIRRNIEIVYGKQKITSFVPTDKDLKYALGRVNPLGMTVEDASFVREIFKEHEWGYLRGFVKLQDDMGAICKQLIVMLSLFGYGGKAPCDDRLMCINAAKLIEKLKKTLGVNSVWIGVLYWHVGYPYPIVLGEDGLLYANAENFQETGSETFGELISHEIRLMEYGGCNVYDTWIHASAVLDETWEYRIRKEGYELSEEEREHGVWPIGYYYGLV